MHYAYKYHFFTRTVHMLNLTPIQLQASHTNTHYQHIQVTDNQLDKSSFLVQGRQYLDSQDVKINVIRVFLLWSMDLY